MEPKDKNHMLFTFRFSLSSAFVVLVVITSLCVGLATYFSVHFFIRQDISERLHDAVGLAAMQIDPEAHAVLQTVVDEGSEAYLTIKKRLQEIQGRTTHVRFVYTMRRNVAGQAVFIVDAEKDPEQMSHLGDVYEGEQSPAMMAAFEKPYRVQVENQFYSDEWGTWLSGYAPVLAENGDLECIVGMDISAARIVGYERRHLFIILAVAAAACLIFALAGVLFSRSLSKPLVLLQDEMSKIQNLELDGNPRIESRVIELIRMKTAVANMKNGLRSFKKYVPAELVSELIRLQKEAALGAEKKQISIFFSDIANFTTISELLGPERMAETLGVYFKGMTGLIHQNKGTVDKFIGDAIMAFWGAPSPVGNHAVLACQTALQCQRHIAGVAESFRQKGLPTLHTRIGLNTGEAVVGNMGFEERLSYTAIGDNVNLASRIEGLNKYYGTGIIISGSTFSAAQNEIEARLLDVVAVKGRSGGVPIYELISEKDNISGEDKAFIARFNTGVSLYLDRKWAEAARVFKEILAARPQDKPAQIMAERCEAYSVNPPPADWNGVIVMREK
ncbi:MAG: adenylate/guanylate cyclase domain-containing protein [Thermodesulfobacteriota bacterium]